MKIQKLIESIRLPKFSTSGKRLSTPEQISLKNESLPQGSAAIRSYATATININKKRVNDEENYKQLILNAPGFGKNEDWAKSMWGEVEIASKKLETKEFKTAVDVLDLFSKKYYEKTFRGAWRSIDWPLEFSSISEPSMN